MAQQQTGKHSGNGRLTKDALERRVQAGDIDTVLTVFPDMYGRLVGKRVTGHYFLGEVADEGMHACDYLFACDMDMDPVPGYAFASWERGYGDVHIVPDLATLRTAAWLERTAIVLCDVHDVRTAELVAVAPRTVLRRQIERAEAQGYVPKAASELEFFLLKESFDDIAVRGFERVDTFGWYVEDYHTLRAAREEPVVGTIRRAMDASGVPVESSKGEWGPGQHEINLRYADMLEMADRHAIYKHGCKDIAASAGHGLTFMAKFRDDLAGNSFHLHASLWAPDGETALFDGGSQSLAGTDVKAPDLFRWFLAGALAHARECSLFFAPNVNSYKRYMKGTFAPTALAWSYDNRTTGFRIVGHDASLRIECRVPGADANPYLAMAALLAAGLDGIAKKLEPPPPFRGDAYRAENVTTVPATLDEALTEFRRSSFIRDAFGEEVVAHYSRFAEVELEKFRTAVTDWERRRLLERI
jgi:glutamine synthetase